MDSPDSKSPTLSAARVLSRTRRRPARQSRFLAEHPDVFHHLKSGIGLRWIDANTLEVAVPSDVEINDSRPSSTYLGHQLQYRYRYLQPNEPAALGCNPK